VKQNIRLIEVKENTLAENDPGGRAGKPTRPHHILFMIITNSFALKGGQRYAEYR
jgi:hypothetical protein